MEPMHPDHALLDIENMSSDQWRAWITSKMANQKGVSELGVRTARARRVVGRRLLMSLGVLQEFINEFKRKMFYDIKKVMSNSQLDDATRETLQKELLNTVNE